jgi:YidC/Oxa1 family membrane protein insertase
LERPVFAFLDVPVAGAFHLIDPLISLLTPALGGTAVAVAVVLFTCAVRGLLHPLARAAARGERARAVLAPKIAELRTKHKNNPQRLQQEVAKLQQESGMSMFAGCLPMLIQAPFFTIMYRLCTSATVHGHPNTLLAGTMFGVRANQHLLSGAGLTSAGFLVFAIILVLLGGVATMSLRWQPTPPTQQPGTGFVRYLVYFPVLVAMILPLAGGIYLLTTTTWTAVERRMLRRDPLVPGHAGRVESAGGGD